MKTQLATFLLFASICINGIVGQHDTGYLVVQNLAEKDIITTIVTDVDEFDWDGNSGPQHNFEDVSISSGTWHHQEEKMYSLAANCPFSMVLMFADDTREKYRINMKYAVDKAQAAFEHLEGSRSVNYYRIGSNVLWIDVRDNGTYCV